MTDARGEIGYGSVDDTSGANGESSDGNATSSRSWTEGGSTSHGHENLW